MKKTKKQKKQIKQKTNKIIFVFLGVFFLNVNRRSRIFLLKQKKILIPPQRNFPPTFGVRRIVLTAIIPTRTITGGDVPQFVSGKSKFDGRMSQSSHFSEPSWFIEPYERYVDQLTLQLYS